MLSKPALNWTAPKGPLITNSYTKYREVANSSLKRLISDGWLFLLVWTEWSKSLRG